MWSNPSKLSDFNVPKAVLYFMGREFTRGHGSTGRHNETRIKTLRDQELDRMWSEAFRDHELAETVAKATYPILEVFPGIVLAQGVRHHDPYV